jgi:Zn-dependent M28 family amino/carboxypeptidase
LRKLALLLLLTAAAFAQDAARHFDGKSWWDHVKVLADDNMEGRDTGSEGLRKAEAYVVEQLKASGLKPKGANGFYQPAKFVSHQLVEQDSSLALVHDGVPHPLTLGDDAFISSRADLPSEMVTAPLVFAGYGLKIPENNYDDLAGLDLKGKVVVYITGSPADVPSAVAAHYQTVAERWKALHAAGVVGVVSILNPASMEIPWSRYSMNRTRPSMNLAGDEFNETPGEKVAVVFNADKAEQLFAGTGHTFAEIADLAKDRKALPHFTLSVSIQSKAHLEVSSLESSNVVAVYPGSDSKLKNEYVVLSAHIDHVGIGAPIDGDKIYNGAMDNASGSALLLDVARSLAQSHEKTRRSVLFVFVTGEEKGLLGSKYFAAHPTVPTKSMVADVNADMFLPIVPLKLLTIYGLGESDLGDQATTVAKSYGVDVQPDPQPLHNIFIRSDQYNFVRDGIPAVMMDVGVVPGSPEHKIQIEWRTHRYHAPSDDLQQPVDFAAAALYEDIVRALTISVANESQRPEWKADSFFRRYAQAAK